MLDEIAEYKYGSAVVQERAGIMVAVFTTEDACRFLGHQFKEGK